MNGFEFPALNGNQGFNDQISLFWQSNLMAQLAQALVLKAGDNGFESHQNHKKGPGI